MNKLKNVITYDKALTFKKLDTSKYKSNSVCPSDVVNPWNMSSK